MGYLWIHNLTWLLAMRDGDDYCVSNSMFIVGWIFWPVPFVVSMYIYFKQGNFIVT